MMLTGPSPPKKIRLATGAEGGGYDSAGKEFQARLGKLGLEVELVNTNGAIDNMDRLLRHEVDVAFAQGGTYPFVEDPQHQLRGLAALYSEPLWIFYQKAKPASIVSDLKGRTIAIGPPLSGTEAVSKKLLEKHGIDPTNSQLVNLSAAEARARLLAGELGAAIFVTSYKDKGLQLLLTNPNLMLMNFHRTDVAHSRQLTYLRPLDLPEGLLNLGEDIPKENVTLLSPSAMLVCRKDLHAQVTEQLLKTAHVMYEPGSLIDPPNHFPTVEGVDLPLDPTAETCVKSGESFLSRVLPYWAVRLLLQLRVVVLPLLAIWVPVLKFVPMVYSYRVNQLLKRHYAALRGLESAIGQADNPDDLRDRIGVLEQLRRDMEEVSRKVRANHQRDVYHWRLHVALVHEEALDRLRRMEGARRLRSSG